MKNLLYKKFSKLSLVVLCAFGLLLSCDSTDDDTSFLDDRTSVAYFVPTTSATLLVEENVTSAYDIKVGISEPKPYDRSFQIMIDPSSTAVEGVDFTINTSNLVIPANSIVGTITVIGDYDASTLEGKTVVINLVSVEDSILGTTGTRNTFTLTLQRFCPVADDFFVGDYMIADVAATVGPGNNTSNFAPGLVTITASGATSRTFTNGVLPAFVPNPLTISFDLICGKIVLNDVATGLSCGGGVAYIFTEAAGSNTPYDDSDDSMYIINYTEDPNGSCGGPYDSSFSLTKVN